MLSYREGEVFQLNGTTGNLQIASSKTVVVFEPGAYVNGAQASVNTVTVHPGHGFDVNDYIYNFSASSSPENTLRQVTAVAQAGTSITFNGAVLSFTDGDRLVNLGDGETGIAGAINFNGSDQPIWTQPNAGTTLITASTVTPNTTTGRYNYWYHGEVWEVILNSSNDPEALVIITDRASTIKTVISAYTVTPSDSIIAVTSTGTSYTLTLPPVANCPVGLTLTFKDQGGGATAFPITIDGNLAELIDGAASVTLATNYQARTLYTNGTAWFTR